ncbi:MAG: GFA family protein [Pseudomonadota bacterium]
MTERSLTGSCLCGAVTYRLTGPFRPVIGCHCQQCRKTSGHFVAATGVARDKITIEGHVSWYQSSPEARRGFCAVCGSSLFWDGEGSSTLAVMAGTLDGPTGLSTAGHIFVADMGDYYELDPDLPKAQGDDPTLTTQVE